MPHDQPENEPFIDDVGEASALKARAEQTRPGVIERHRAEEITFLYRLKKLGGRVADSAMASGVTALSLFPILCLGVLLLDLPATLFDGWAARDSLRPSRWLSRGDLIMGASLFVTLLMTRRHGGAIVTQALGFAWILLGVVSIIMLIYHAPSLAPGDLPPGRFTIGFVAGWYGGAWVAIKVYDMTRGSRWWRPPALALLAGFLFQSLVTIPVTYAGTGLPWTWWLGANVIIQCFQIVVYVAIYRLVRQRFSPRVGRATGFGSS